MQNYFYCLQAETLTFWNNWYKKFKDKRDDDDILRRMMKHLIFFLTINGNCILIEQRIVKNYTPCDDAGESMESIGRRIQP